MCSSAICICIYPPISRRSNAQLHPISQKPQAIYLLEHKIVLEPAFDPSREYMVWY